MNRKGMAMSILAIVVALFMTGIFSLIALVLWNNFNATIQSIDDAIIAPHVKAQIDELTGIMLWGDKVFVLLFIALFIGFILTSMSISNEKGIYLLLYMIYLAFLCVLAMVLSNAWDYLTQDPNFIAAIGDMKFTDWFLTYLPIITFFVGVVGGVIFYARTKGTGSSGGELPE